MISVASGTNETKIAPLGNSLWYWAAVGECIANQYNVPVAFFNSAWGGTTITSYSLSIDPNYAPLGAPAGDNQNPQNPRYRAGTPYGGIRNTLVYFGSTYGLRAVLWMQGETDTQGLTDVNDRWRTPVPPTNERRAITDANDYTNKLRAVINATRSRIGYQIPWVIARTSLFAGTTSSVVINGQNAVINPGDRIYPGPETDGILDRLTGGGEPTHFNNQGLINAGNAWCSALPNVINNAPPATIQSLGTEPQSLEISNDGHSIRAPNGTSFSWVDENGGVTDPDAVFSTQQTISADQNATATLNSVPYGGETRAIVTNGAGNLIFTQAVRLPYTLVDDTGGTPTPTTQSCTDFPTTCSGNNSEIRNITINVATEGDYPLTISYQSSEGNKTGIVQAGGSSQNLSFNQTAGGAFATATTTATFHLTAGNNTVGLSSGPAGGYLCFNKICVGSGGTPNPTNCDFNISANSVSANCNQAVTLNATCAGANCDNITYTWSGNGLN